VAAEGESELKFRALCLAGRAAHIASREEEALELYRRAEAVAPTHLAHRDALWGQLVCMIELELPEATENLQALAAGVSRSDTRGVLQSYTYSMAHGTRFGHIDLAGADTVCELVPAVADPLVVSSFQSVYAWALGLAARYDDALRVAQDLSDTATRYRLDFAVPYSLSTVAVACAGLRRWRQAEEAVVRALALSRAARDVAAQQNAFSIYLRVLAQQRRQEVALLLDIPSLQGALPAARAEVALSRALVLASLGRVEESRRILSEERHTSRAILPTVLIAAVWAISAVKQSEPNAIERVIELEQTAYATGALDVVVTAYRSTPELLPILLRSGERERLGLLLKQAGDEDLAVAAGDLILHDDNPKARLSPREREVYELLGQSLTNLQIGQLLFISEATVKLHVHHIYDKLGIRSRTAVAVLAALDRADQATSAIEGVESDSGS